MLIARPLAREEVFKKSTTQHVGTQNHPDDRGMHTASAHHTHSGPRNITLTAKRGGSGTHYFKGYACSFLPCNEYSGSKADAQVGFTFQRTISCRHHSCCSQQHQSSSPLSLAFATWCQWQVSIRSHVLTLCNTRVATVLVTHTEKSSEHHTDRETRRLRYPLFQRLCMQFIS